MRSPPHPSFLQAEQAQLPQPVFTREVLQPSGHLSGPSLDPPQQLFVFLVLGATDLDAVLKMGPHEGRGTVTSLSLLATPLLMEPRIPSEMQEHTAG